MSQESLANITFSHYRIVKPPGAGGMGEIYLAEDTRLDCNVALKLLPAEFATEPDRVRRFIQEAKAASALNHPNIITVYDIGACEAGRFIVMELVTGRTLRTVIAEDNSVETLLTLGQQMAKALSATHAAGITHRDIKPGNIMVRGMIERKIAQLGEDDRKLLTCASVQGYEFDSAVLAQALKLDANEIEERLEKLERVFAFVKLTSESEFPNGTLTLKYRFVHVLYQNALYASLRATRKATLSRDVAQALEACYGARGASVANELALLWEAARDYARAGDSFLQAARNAALINAHREAAQLAERGLEAVRKLPETPERDERELGLQLTRGFSLQSALSWVAPEAGAAFNRARQLCQQMGDDPRLFAALSGDWSYHVVQAEYETAQGLCEQMLQLAEQAQDPVLLISASKRWGEVHFYQGDLISAQQQFERARSLDRRKYHEAYFSVSSEDMGIGARRHYSYCLWTLGYADRALALALEAVTLPEQTVHPFSLGGAHLATGMVLAYLRDWPSSQQEFGKVFALAEEYALGDLLNWATALNALNLAYQDPTEEALEWAKQAIESLRDKGVMLGMTGRLASLGEVFGRAGCCAEGLDVIADALALVERTGERFYEAELWRIKGELLLQAAASQAQAEAERCYHQALEIARQQSAKAWELRAATSLARLWQQQGKQAEARQMLAEIYGWFTEGFDTADLQEAKALLRELQP